MTEQFALEASRELDRILAEKAGYNVRLTPPDDDGEQFYALYQKDGKLVEGADMWFAVEYAWNDCPPASSNFDAATTYIVGDMRLSLHNEDYPRWLAVVFLDTDLDNADFLTDWVASAETPALAVCRALLVYYEAMEERRAGQTNTTDRA